MLLWKSLNPFPGLTVGGLHRLYKTSHVKFDESGNPVKAAIGDNVVVERVSEAADTKTGTILTNTIQFLFESYPILM